MTLREVLEQLGEVDDNLTIYAEGGPRADLSSEAALLMEPEDGSLPPGAEGMEYLLEVFGALEVLEVWSKWRDGRVPTLEEGYAAISHYAKHDAYLPADG